jgi:putative membrane-bound dehydrogenase-like protein
MRRLSLLALLALPLFASAQPTHQVKLNGHTFTLPEGFTIEVAANAKMAPRPIACAFDEQGRLYVTDSSGSNAKVADQLKEKPHRILRLESTKGDGVFDKQTVFVKNVMFPEGCMWLNGSLYVAAPPHILKLTDTNDDGVADKEEIWFDGKTLTGCANDLHGPYRGPDGYIYWTKGAFAKQEHTINGKKFTTRASHIFRAKPDGSNLDVVMTGGMDNPVDLVFTPSGDIIFSTTFFQHPAGGKRDGLVHAVYGGVYGKDHDVVYEHPWTSPSLMPPLTHMGPAAPCGLHRYESDQFGKDYANNVFACQFNLRKVSRHILVPKGSTYETKDSDFVASDNIDFHPTDVIEDADGSLLIVDTGGWYKLCCPTSQLVKPDVTGAIYRVKKVGAHTAKAKPKPEPLSRIKLIGLKRDKAALPKVVVGLYDTDPHTRRHAAEAAGRIGDPSAVPHVLKALANDENDRELDHALTYALIELGDTEATAKGLTHAAPRVRRAALAALSNIPNSGLEAKTVLAELDAKDGALRETAWWIAGRNPQWGDALADHLKERFKRIEKMTPPEQDELVARAVPFAKTAAVRKVLGDALAATPVAPADRAILRGLARSGLKAFPDEWKDGVLLALGSRDPETVKSAIAVLRAVPPTAAQHADIAGAAVKYRARLKIDTPAELDYALRAAAPPGTVLPDEDAALVIRDTNTNATGPTRAAAADLLTRAKLSAAELDRLANALPAANPLELPKLLGAFAQSTDEKVGLAFVRALRAAKVRPLVRVEMVKPILDKYPKAVRDEVEKLYAELAEARKGETAKLDAMLKELKPGDIRRGQIVFNSKKTQCIACHKVGYVGGLAGPDLTRIGGIRTERDLLEAILFPSASFVRSYEPVRVVTTDERVLNGVLKKDAPDEIVVVVAADKEERVARADIASIAPSTVSLMPAGLEQQLSPQEIADLLAFLRACK